MKETWILRFLVIFFCVLGVMTGCSSQGGVAPTVEKKSQMPMEYPRVASRTLERLGEWIPADSRALFVSSYGSLAEAIVQFKAMNWVDATEMAKTLEDLGRHYHLNPSLLSSWFQAGFHTGSGFVVGLTAEDAIYAIADVWDRTAFRTWWDHFLLEEYGRPESRTETAEGVEYVQLKTMHRDAATLVMRGNDPVLVVFGEAIAGHSMTKSSLEIAKSLKTSPVETSQKLARWREGASTQPMALYVHHDVVERVLSERWRDVSQFFSGIEVEFGLRDASSSVHLTGMFSEATLLDGPVEAMASKLISNQAENWSSVIAATSPASWGRIAFDAETLESILLPELSASQRSQYKKLKDKLTQRLIRIDVSQQVIYNVASVWGAIYEKDDQTFQVVYIPLKSATRSDAFFSKLNILKGVIPADKAVLEDANGILHATIRGKTPLHVGYAKGLLAVTTSEGWDTVERVFAMTTNSNDVEGKPIAMHVRSRDLATFIPAFARYLAPYASMDLEADVSEDAIEMRLTGVHKSP